DPTWASSLAEYRVVAAEFVEALRPLTVLGRLTGFRRVPVQTRIPRATFGSSVGWVGDSKPIRLSKLALDSIQLNHYRLAGIVAPTNELVQLSTPSADTLIRSDLLSAVAAFTDRALLDPSAAEVTGVSPASITNGALQFVSSGATVANITSDLEKLFEAVA